MKEGTFYEKIQLKAAALANWPNAEPTVGALVTEKIPELCKIPYDYYFRDDPVAQAECTLLMQEYFDLDFLYCNNDVYNFEAEAMGAKINFYKDHCPDFDRSEYFIKGWEDLDKIKFTGLDKGRFPFLLEFCKAYTRLTGGYITQEFSGPWTIAGNLYGVENLVMATYEDPEFVTELLRRIVVDFHVPMYKALQKEYPGFALMLYGDAFASVPIVTPDIVDEFIRPALELEVSAMNDPNAFMIDCAFFGMTELPEALQPRFLDFILYGNHSLMLLDPDLERLGPKKCREMANEMGQQLSVGLASKFTEFAPIEDIIARVKETMLICKNGKTPLSFQFLSINPSTDDQKIKTMVDAAKTYARIGADENTVFEIKTYPTFEEFLKYKMEHNPEGFEFQWLEKSEYAYLLKK